MDKIPRINIIAFAKFQGFLTVLLGLLAGILYSFGGLIVDSLVSMELITSYETPGLSYGTLLAFGALIGMPILFGIAGFIAGICEAILYNLYAKWFGGYRIDFYI